MRVCIHIYNAHNMFSGISHSMLAHVRTCTIKCFSHFRRCVKNNVCVGVPVVEATNRHVLLHASASRHHSRLHITYFKCGPITRTGSTRRAAASQPRVHAHVVSAHARAERGCRHIEDNCRHVLPRCINFEPMTCLSKDISNTEVTFDELFTE